MKQAKKVFLVDDDKIYLYVTQQNFHKKFPQIAVYSFMSGQEALIALESNIPDILFLDLNMPVMDGWEFLEELSKKKLPQYPDIYITTSSIDIFDKEKAANHPLVKGYIEKPLTVEKISKVLFS